MQFIIRAYDGKNKLSRRMEVRSRHLENLSKVDAAIICAGELLDDAGKMKGSVLVMDFDTRDALEQYLKTEPYIVEGVWEKVEVGPMNVVIVDGRKVGK